MHVWGGLDRVPPIQTQLFARRLTRALRAALPGDLQCISIAPISEFPTSNLQRVRALPPLLATVEGRDVTYRTISYINTKHLKVPSRTVALLASVIRHGLVPRTDLVIVYSVHVPLMLSGLVLARLTSSKSIAVWTDPPAVELGGEGRLTSLARRIERFIAGQLMSRFDGVIAVTRELAEDFAPQAPNLVLDAFWEDSDREEPKYRGPEVGTVITYTGTLDRRYGIDRLVAAAALIPSEERIVLRIYGRGDFESEVARISSSCPSVEFMGGVGHAEALLAQSRSDFLINVRDPQQSYTRHSFPSKTLEYLASGVPVISTALVGLSEEYRACMLILESNEPGDIARGMIRASRLASEQRRNLGAKGRTLARTRSVAKQSQRISDFLESNG